LKDYGNWKVLLNAYECGRKNKVKRISEKKTSPVRIMMDQKQVENVEYFIYWGRMTTSDGGRTREIKSRIARGKVALKMISILFTCQLDLNLRKKLVKCYIWSIVFLGAETWTLQKVCRKNLESFEMCWRRMEKISWTDLVRNEEV